MSRYKYFGFNLKSNFLILVIGSISIWASITTVIQAFKCPEMTDTQRFLAIPNSFILNFKTCQ